MLLKEKATQRASRDKQADVYYITLANTSDDGRPLVDQDMFSVATKMEMQDQNVHVMDAWDLFEFFQNENPSSYIDSSEVNLFDLLQHFIKKKPKSDIFIDEAPFFLSSRQLTGLSLIVCHFFIGRAVLVNSAVTLPAETAT